MTRRGRRYGCVRHSGAIAGPRHVPHKEMLHCEHAGPSHPLSHVHLPVPPWVPCSAGTAHKPGA